MEETDELAFQIPESQAKIACPYEEKEKLLSPVLTIIRSLQRKHSFTYTHY